MRGVTGADARDRRTKKEQALAERAKDRKQEMDRDALRKQMALDETERTTVDDRQDSEKKLAEERRRMEDEKAEAAARSRWGAARGGMQNLRVTRAALAACGIENATVLPKSGAACVTARACAVREADHGPAEVPRRRAADRAPRGSRAGTARARRRRSRR